MNHSIRSERRIPILKRWWRHTGGVAFIEFALVWPFFIILIFGGIEITRALLIQQRVERASYALADMISQYAPAQNPLLAGQLSEAELTANVFPQLSRILGSYSNPADQAIIATSFRREGAAMRINWQKASAADTLTGCDALTPANCVQSIVNGRTPGTINAGVANTLTSFPAAEQAILGAMVSDTRITVVEVYYQYRPILSTLLQSVGTAGAPGFAGFNFFLAPRIYIKRSFLVPREQVSATDYLPPTFPAP
jgi:Flp pilus assembly protein TadG